MSAPEKWTADQTAILKDGWSAGLSGLEIAKELGMTRNAVIGKVHRLKLEKRRTVSRGKCKPRRRKKVQQQPKKVLVCDGPVGGIPFLDGDDRCCRFPLWEVDAHIDDKMICGAGIIPGRMYCDFHKAMMFRKEDKAA